MANDNKNKTESKNTAVENSETVTVTLTKEQLETLNNLEAEKTQIEKEKEEVAARQKEITEKELANESKQTARKLKNTQKMVTITVPVSELNPHDKIVPVCINGYLWQIKRGEEVTVPEEVKNILKEAKYI